MSPELLSTVHHGAVLELVPNVIMPFCWHWTLIDKIWRDKRML